MRCPKCNAECSNDAVYCTNCGEPLQTEQPQYSQNYNPNEQYQQPYNSEYTMNGSQLYNSEYVANGGEYFEPSMVKKSKAIAILMYFIPILILIPFVEKEHKTPYCIKHANNVVVLFIFNIGIYIVRTILATLLSDLLNAPWLATIVSLLTLAASILLVVLGIIGIVYAAKGKTKDLPILGKIRIFK